MADRRLSDTIIGTNSAYGKAHTAPMVNLNNGGGGSFGFLPDYTSYVSATPYVRRNVIARLIQAPTAFDRISDGQKYIDALKAMVELLPRTINGLQSGLTPEFIENPFGGAGETISDVSDMKRAQSTPSFVWDERHGKPIQNYLSFWLSTVMMDPETKYPRIVSNGDRKPTDLLIDFKSMTVLFFEPDPTHTKVMDAWLCMGMMPRGDGPREGRRDLTSAGEGLELDIEFTATTQVGLAVNAMAQNLLDEINRYGANPNTRAAYADRIDADVKAGNAGYAEQIEEVSRSAVRV